MPYTPQTWHDSPARDTPIDAAALTHIEQGISDVDSGLSSEVSRAKAAEALLVPNTVLKKYQQMVLPSGDTTGSTDTAAINAALTAFPRPKAVLAPGTFYINAPITPQNNTWLQGSGILTTTIQQSSTFTGSCMYQAALSSTISDLTLQGYGITTASNPQADGVYITQQGSLISSVTARNIRFANINGWCVHQYDAGTYGEPTGCLYEGLRDGKGNAGGMGFFGASRSLGMVIQNCNLIASGGTSTTLDGLYMQDAFDLEVINSYFGSGGTSTGHGYHFYGHCNNGRFVMSEIGGPSVGGTGASGIKIEDGPNGHSSVMQFIGMVIQTYDRGVDLEGTCTDISFTDVEFNANYSHGAVINTSGTDIEFNNCRWGKPNGFSNGYAASGTNYDLNWTGTATGSVTGCRFGSPIVSTGTKGVQKSVNIAAGQNVSFVDVKFNGTGASAANWFTALPSTVLETTNGFNLVTAPVAGSQITQATSVQKLAATPLSGVPLTNGTQTIFTWTAPNDGNMHRVALYQVSYCSSAATGGGISLNWTLPDGTHTIGKSYTGGYGAGTGNNLEGQGGLVAPGTTVTFSQTTALTAGAATIWAELWGY